MVDLAKKIFIEFQNIENIITELPSVKKIPQLSTLELAGVATFLHNFYNGIENILKLIFKDKKIPLPKGKSWHKELLEIAGDRTLISQETRIKLGTYLAFRHFFSHAYALDLFPDKMEPLVEDIDEVFAAFKRDITDFLSNSIRN